MHSRILVPLDGSVTAEQMLPYVRLLAKRLQARVELLRVVEHLPPEWLDWVNGVEPLEVAARMSHQAEEYLEGVAASLSDDALPVSVNICGGTNAASIVAEAEKEPDTLLAMCSHGRSGITRWILGSVTDRVLHATTTPLLVVRAKEQEATTEAELENVIVPLDESPPAEQVLPHAVYLARTLGLRIILLRVTPAAGDYYRTMEYVPGNLRDIAQFIDGQAMEYLHKVGQRLMGEGLPQVEEQLLHGHPAAAIVDLAQATPHSLVTMTTHGRSGVGRWLLGSVADRVVCHSAGPVMMVRPAEEHSD